MSGYKEVDAAKDTKTSQREVDATWHHARDESGVRDGGTGDRPTAQNRKDAKELTRKVIERGRGRPAERPDGRER